MGREGRSSWAGQAGRAASREQVEGGAWCWVERVGKRPLGEYSGAYGVTQSSPEPLPILAPPLLPGAASPPTAVTTSPQVALETRLRTGELGHGCPATGGALPSARIRGPALRPPAGREEPL